MKKTTVKKSKTTTATAPDNRPFTLVIWRRESYRANDSDLAENCKAFMTLTNAPDSAQLAAFKRIMRATAAFQRLHGNPMPVYEKAVKEKRLADAGRELLAQGIVQGSTVE